MGASAKKMLVGLAAWAAVAAHPGHAEDIDLFSGIQAQGVRPNVLIVLDNSGAWNSNVTFDCPSTILTLPKNNINTAGGFEQCALSDVLRNISTNTALLNNFNMGMMLFSTGSGTGGSFYFPGTAAPGALPAMDAIGISDFQSALANLQVGGSASNTANASAVGATMQEAWAFFSAKTGFSGTNYSTSPISNPCQKNFIIYIVNATNTGKPQDNTDNTVFQTLACPAGSPGPNGASCGGATSAQQTAISLNPTYAKYQGSWADEWARFEYQTDLSGNFTNQQNIVTYTIAVSDGSNPDYVELLRSMAANGGGKTFYVKLGDMAALVQAILKVLNEVQAVNSVFASASLPVSANAQGTYQNQIFMGMFRPELAGLPRWLGNLKQYQFGVDTSSGAIQLFMADATGAHALSSSGTGFISPNAISFWTSSDPGTLPDSSGGFWRNKVQGAGGGLDLPDGEVVEKGGAGQQIRLANLQDDYAANPTSPRNVYTYCPGGSGCNSPLSDPGNAFATSNSGITASMLNASGNAIKVAAIQRSGTTATVTLGAAPNPALAAGQAMTITGSNNGYNGAYTVATVPSATSFTIAAATIPPSPATGTYVAAIPSTPVSVASLTRSSSNRTTAVAITSAPHGLAVGSQVTLSGGTSGTFSTNPLYSAYYGTFTVTGSTSATEFEYSLSEGPAATLDAPSATATVGTTTDTLTSSGNLTLAAPSIQRAASTLVGGVWTSVVTVTTTTPMASPFVAGATVRIAGTGTAYDNDAGNPSWTISAVANCPGGLKVSGKSYSFCFNMPTTPDMPNPATSSSTVTATPVSGAVVLSSLSRAGDSCPSINAAVATAVTASPHGFAVGSIVNVGGTPGVNENAYVGNFKVLSVPSSTSFTYWLNTRPLCTDDGTASPNLTASTGGVTRDTLIRWTRGEDNFGDEPSPGAPINIRPSVHGDVVHARPTVVNYGGSTGVVVFYGSGDGTFRAVNGNQPGATPSSIGTTPPGGELWAFIPPEFYSKLLRLHDNLPVVRLFSTPAGLTPPPLPKDYFFDGIAGVYQNFNTGQVYLYLSARRGGRLLYALDVSDPKNPKFLWRRSNADAGFSELGQTWAQPKVALVKGYANPVLIFGAGYDPNEDAEPPIADTMGRGIFILDAITGNLVWRAGPGGGTDSCSGTPCLLKDMTYAVPADVTLLDVTADGFVDRAYAADVGGNIWRVDFEPSAGNAPAFWQVNRLASLGGASTDATRRKFLFPPDAVNTGKFTAVIAVTGDREHPLYAMKSTSIVNRFYMIKDTQTGLDASGMVPVVDDSSNTLDTSPTDLFNATTAAYDGSLRGFYVTLTNPGEKGVNAPVTVGGFSFFGTNSPTMPNPNACDASLGTARSYQIGFLSGKVGISLLQGGGLPPSPVAGLVNVDVAGKLTTVPFIIGGASPGCIGADCQSSIGAQKANIPINPIRSRAYWYRDVDN